MLKTPLSSSRYLLTICFVLALVSCSDRQESTQYSGVISGQVTYRERMLLPQDAQITVRLEDVSRQDVAAEIIAETSFAANGAPPYAFTLTYDPALIDDRRSYSVRARIEAERQLMFMSTTSIPPFEQEQLEITVTRVTGQSQTDQPDASLENTYWQLIALGDQPARTGSDGQALHLVLSQGSLRGFAGCNNVISAYEIDAESLEFSLGASTLMACSDSMEIEQQFLQMLENTASYDIEGAILSLYSATGELLAQFESIYL